VAFKNHAIKITITKKTIITSNLWVIVIMASLTVSYKKFFLKFN